MSNLLPIIEQLADARTHAERADWLSRCPIGILGKYRFTIVNRLRVSGFFAGIEYVETVGAILGAVRHPGLLAARLDEAERVLREAIGDAP